MAERHIGSVDVGIAKMTRATVMTASGVRSIGVGDLVEWNMQRGDFKVMSLRPGSMGVEGLIAPIAGGVAYWVCLARLDPAERKAPKIEALPSPSASAVAALEAFGAAARGVTYPDQPTLTINMEPVSEEVTVRALAHLAHGISALADRRDDDAAVHLAEAQRLANIVAPRHNATCPRCYGPAFHGFGYAPTCEREGGCLADVEPRIGEEQRHESTSDPRARLDVVVWRTARGEHEDTWYAFTEPTTAYTAGPFATRDLAVAAWREALLARAKVEHETQSRGAR